MLFALLVSAGYLLGVARVPFHPDESTQIYMSGDLELFLRDPLALAWTSQPDQPLRQNYRLLDAPLARTLIGLGRLAAGRPALPSDWNWSQSWEQNSQAGALPDARLLLVSRLSVALLFPFSLLLFYATARSLGGPPLAWLSTLLFAGNALVLLHTRRAMAEGPLLFTSVLTLWALVRWRKHLWLLGILAALAFNAKQTAAALALVGLIAIWWPSHRALHRRFLDTLLYGLVFALVTALLNPFLWSHPLQAAREAIAARAYLVGDQTRFLGAASANQVLDSWLERLIGMISQLFIAPPAIADVGNYLQQTRASELAYLSNPLNALLRSFTGGSIIMLLTLYGYLLAGLGLRRAGREQRRVLGILWLATLAQFAALLAALPIPFQRYYLPLVPFVCLWSGYAIITTTRALTKTRRLSAA